MCVIRTVCVLVCRFSLKFSPCCANECGLRGFLFALHATVVPVGQGHVFERAHICVCEVSYSSESAREGERVRTQPCTLYASELVFVDVCLLSSNTLDNCKQETCTSVTYKRTGAQCPKGCCSQQPMLLQLLLCVGSCRQSGYM